MSLSLELGGGYSQEMIVHSYSTQCQVPIGTGFKSAFRYSGCAGSPDLFIFKQCKFSSSPSISPERFK